MKIALLLCDHVRQDLQPAFGDYADMFRDLFARHIPAMDLHVFDVKNGDYPDSPEGYDGFVITGSASSVYDDDAWIAGLRDYVRELHGARKRVVGICFGHQMIAHALGGKVARAGRGWGVGVKEATLESPQPWMRPPLSSYRLLLIHQDQVESLPVDARVLAGNAHCPVSMFEIPECCLGIQGHPEFSGDYVQALMDTRRERIGEKVVVHAESTLGDPVHTAEICAWVEGFLAQ